MILNGTFEQHHVNSCKHGLPPATWSKDWQRLAKGPWLVILKLYVALPTFEIHQLGSSKHQEKDMESKNAGWSLEPQKKYQATSNINQLTKYSKLSCLSENRIPSKIWGFINPYEIILNEHICAIEVSALFKPNFIRGAISIVTVISRFFLESKIRHQFLINHYLGWLLFWRFSQGQSRGLVYRYTICWNHMYLNYES